MHNGAGRSKSSSGARSLPVRWNPPVTVQADHGPLNDREHLLGLKALLPPTSWRPKPTPWLEISRGRARRAAVTARISRAENQNGERHDWNESAGRSSAAIDLGNPRPCAARVGSSGGVSGSGLAQWRRADPCRQGGPGRAVWRCRQSRGKKCLRRPLRTARRPRIAAPSLAVTDNFPGRDGSLRGWRARASQVRRARSHAGFFMRAGRRVRSGKISLGGGEPGTSLGALRCANGNYASWRGSS
jgi:hypothetical protein